MSDLISREELMKLWDEYHPYIATRAIQFDQALRKLPSAEPVRHGKWEMKPDPYGFFNEIPVCSECGCTTKMREKTKYCPHCGARMDEDERD